MAHGPSTSSLRVNPFGAHFRSRAAQRPAPPLCRSKRAVRPVLDRQFHFAHDAPPHITCGRLFAFFGHALDGEDKRLAEVHHGFILSVSLVHDARKRWGARDKPSRLVFFDYDRVTPLVVHRRSSSPIIYPSRTLHFVKSLAPGVASSLPPYETTPYRLPPTPSSRSATFLIHAPPCKVSGLSGDLDRQAGGRPRVPGPTARWEATSGRPCSRARRFTPGRFFRHHH